MCSSKVILIWDVQNFCNFVVSSFELTSVLKIPEQNLYYTSFSELWRNPEIFSCFILDWCVFSPSRHLLVRDLLCRLNITKALGLQVPSKREHGLHSGPAGVWKVGTKQLQLNWNLKVLVEDCFEPGVLLCHHLQKKERRESERKGKFFKGPNWKGLSRARDEKTAESHSRWPVLSSELENGM